MYGGGYTTHEAHVPKLCGEITVITWCDALRATSHNNTVYRTTVKGTLLWLLNNNTQHSPEEEYSHLESWVMAPSWVDGGAGATQRYAASLSERIHSVVFVWNHLTFDNIITCGYSALSSQHNEDFHYPRILIFVCEVQVERSGTDWHHRNSQVLFM